MPRKPRNAFRFYRDGLLGPTYLELHALRAPVGGYVGPYADGKPGAKEAYERAVAEAVNAFADRYAVDGVFCLGRGGRHVCIPDTQRNRRRYHYLSQKAIEAAHALWASMRTLLRPRHATLASACLSLEGANGDVERATKARRKALAELAETMASVHPDTEASVIRDGGRGHVTGYVPGIDHLEEYRPGPVHYSRLLYVDPRDESQSETWRKTAKPGARVIVERRSDDEDGALLFVRLVDDANDPERGDVVDELLEWIPSEYVIGTNVRVDGSAE